MAVSMQTYLRRRQRRREWPVYAVWTIVGTPFVAAWLIISVRTLIWLCAV